MQFEHFSLMELVSRSIDTGSVVVLIKGLASLLLTVINTLQNPAHLLGPLLLAEGLGTPKHGCPWWVRWSIILLILHAESIYLHDITYDFGVPAVIMMAIFIISQDANLARSIVHKTVVLLLLLFGVQWLDIDAFLAPIIWPRFSVGLIKTTAAYLNYASDTFNVMGLSVVICVANAFAGSHPEPAGKPFFKDVGWKSRVLENRSLGGDLKTPDQHPGSGRRHLISVG